MPVPRSVDRVLHARELLKAIGDAADPVAALRGKLAAMAPDLLGTRGRLVVASIGKAALPMAREAHMHLGPRIDEGIATIPPLAGAAAPDLPGFEVHECDHPYPSARNVGAAGAVAGVLDRLGADDTLVVLLSGGGSAHLCLPAGELTLDDLSEATRRLQLAGATIGELNAVRKHCERLKGGLAGVRARCARVVVFVLSDVIGNDLSVISSGPFAPDPTTYADAVSVLERYGLVEVLPRVARHLSAGVAGVHGETVKPPVGPPVGPAVGPTIEPGGDPLAHVRTVMLSSNRQVLAAVQGRVGLMGFRVVGNQCDQVGEAAGIGRRIGGQCRLLAASPARLPAAWVWGGEPTVTVSSDGRDDVGVQRACVGGPSQELALAAACEVSALPNVAILAISTDGRDGPTDAAGAFVTGETWGAIRRAGLDPTAALRDHDSNTVLAKVGATVTTGPTGTNLNHVVIALVYPG